MNKENKYYFDLKICADKLASHSLYVHMLAMTNVHALTMDKRVELDSLYLQESGVNRRLRADYEDLLTNYCEEEKIKNANN